MFVAVVGVAGRAGAESELQLESVGEGDFIAGLQFSVAGNHDLTDVAGDDTHGDAVKGVFLAV